MLDLVTRHGGLDLRLTAKGDLHVDQHHTVEDVGIALGEAVNAALGNKKRHSPRRLFPDAHGRNPRGRRHRFWWPRLLRRQGEILRKTRRRFPNRIGGRLFSGVCAGRRANVHLRVLYGRSSHHQVEALFKAFARALRFAVSRDMRLRNVLPSTKELL